MSSVLPHPLRRAFALVLIFLTASLATAAEATKTFNLPAGDAAQTLKQFSVQSGREIVFAPAAVAAVKTNEVKGDLAPKAALDALLADTGLVATQDAKTGAFAVRRDASPNGPRAAQTATARPAKVEDGKLVLDPYEVSGRKIDGLINKGIIPTDAGAPVYHQVVTRADIERLGVSNVEELFRFIPQTSSGTTSLQTAVGNIGLSARYSTVSLRGFSAAQTVILINGRQLPRTGAFGSGGPDLDRIPLAAIERVEIMPLAGSAIYGAGAVGGAINIILRKDYAGRDLTTYIGTATDGGATEFRATYVDGRNFNAGRTNLTLTVSYNRREGLRAGQRDYLDDVLARYGPNTTVRSAAGVSAFETFTIPAFASTAPIIRILNGPTAAVNDLGVPGAPGLRWVQVPAGTTNAQSGALTPGSFTATAGKFTPNERYGRMMLYQPEEGLNLNAQVEHKFIPGRLEGYGEFTVGRTSRNFTVPEASALFFADTDPLNPFRTNVTPGFVGRSILVFFDAPDVPDARFTSRSDSARAVLGLKGELTPKWSWSADGAIDYANNTTTVRTPLNNGGLATVLSLFAPAGAADATTRRSLYNIFADHNRFPISSADADKYFGFARRNTNKSVQQEYNLRVTGEAFELPAGPLKASVAGKFRVFDLDTGFTQRSTNDFYLLTTGAPTPVIAENPTTAKRNTWQGAVELAVPVISSQWRPVPVESLDLNLSASTESFDASGINQSSGSGFAFKSKRGETYVAAGKLQITRAIAIRASYSQGIYPPDWSDLSDPISTFTSTSSLPDPKRGMTVSSTDYLVTNGGNPGLQPEKASSQNIGVLFTPRFLPGFSLTVDFWRTRKSNAINFVFDSDILSAPDDYPAYLTRAAPTPAEAALGWAGAITGVRTGPINIAQLQTNGVDVQGRYEFPSPIAGKITLLGNASFTDHFQTRALPASDLVETAGAGGPLRRRGYGSATWEGKRVSVTVTGRYVDHYRTSTTSPSATFPFATGYDGGRIPAFVRVDLQASYSFPTAAESGWSSGLKITLGVLNALDDKPSFVSDGAVFYNRQDDPRQRFAYVSCKKSF